MRQETQVVAAGVLEPVNNHHPVNLFSGPEQGRERRLWADLLGELLLESAEVQYLVDQLAGYYAPGSGEFRTLLFCPPRTRLAQVEEWVQTREESSQTRRTDLLEILRQATAVVRAREWLMTPTLRLQQASAIGAAKPVLAVGPGPDSTGSANIIDRTMLRVMADEARGVRFALERNVASFSSDYGPT